MFLQLEQQISLRVFLVGKILAIILPTVLQTDYDFEFPVLWFNRELGSTKQGSSKT